MAEQKLEHCIVCDEPTGNAGIKDDSIYVDLKGRFINYEKGDFIGALCMECYKALIQLGLVDDDES